MRKVVLLASVLFLVGCGQEELVHEDMKTDVNQSLELLDKAYEEERELTEEEEDLIDRFQDKYEIGKFVTRDGSEYEMNSLEKVLANTVASMKSFTEPEVTLESETDHYTKLKNETVEYIEMKEIPESFSVYEELFPTYELYSGIHPEFSKDAEELIVMFDPLVNGIREDVDRSDLDKIDFFLNKYEGSKFEKDEKLYKLNDESFDIYFAFVQLKTDIESGGLTNMTAELFNDAKTILGL